MTGERSQEIRSRVRESYAATAEAGERCCGPPTKTAKAVSRGIGYSDSELEAVPEESVMGLGCGNPTAIASLKPGETVLDLGCGGGLDCFLAARQVGPEGRVIGVDMTPAMLEKARVNAAKGGYDNVEFRLSEIEHLPVADASVDVMLSNCVINLSPDKAAVFREAFRVLKPGGRLSISDIVATAPLPEALTGDIAMVAGCIGGAAAVDDIVGWLEQAGFGGVRVTVKEKSRAFIADWAPGSGAEKYVASAFIEGSKP